MRERKRVCGCALQTPLCQHNIFVSPAALNSWAFFWAATLNIKWKFAPSISQDLWGVKWRRADSMSIINLFDVISSNWLRFLYSPRKKGASKEMNTEKRRKKLCCWSQVYRFDFHVLLQYKMLVVNMGAYLWHCVGLQEVHVEIKWVHRITMNVISRSNRLQKPVVLPSFNLILSPCWITVIGRTTNKMQQIRWQQRSSASVLFFDASNIVRTYYLIRSFIFTPITMLIKGSLNNDNGMEWNGTAQT